MAAVSGLACIDELQERASPEHAGRPGTVRRGDLVGRRTRRRHYRARDWPRTDGWDVETPADQDRVLSALVMGTVLTS